MHVEKGLSISEEREMPKEVNEKGKLFQSNPATLLFLCKKKRAAPVSSKLVDPASDHILRSKTKPCMSKTKQVVSESAYGSLNESSPPREQLTAG